MGMSFVKVPIKMTASNHNKTIITELSDSPERLDYLKSLRDIHWYVLRLPATSRDCESELSAEVARRKEFGEPTFDFFALTIVGLNIKKASRISS